MAWNMTASLMSRIASAYASVVSLPAVTNKFIILCNGGSGLTRESTMLDFVSLELPEGSGYSRRAYSPAIGAYDASQTRHELTTVDNTYVAGASALQFDTVAIVSGLTNGATAISNRSVTSVDTGTSKLLTDPALGALGLTTSSLVTVTAGAGGTVPPALLNAGQPRAMFVKTVVDNSGERSVVLSLTSGDAALAVTGGTLPYRIHYLGQSTQASVDFYDVVGTTTVAAAAAQVVRCAMNFSDGNTDVNAV